MADISGIGGAPSGFLKVEVGSPTPILAVGPVGPARNKLLAGRSVRLVPCDTKAEAVSLATIHKPKLCLVRWKLLDGSAVEVIEALKARGAAAPTIVALLEPDEWKYADHCLHAGATDIVGVSDIFQLLRVISQHLGMNYGRALRARVEGPVWLRNDEDWQKLETADLRPNGISVKVPPPRVEVGALIRARLDVLGHMVEVWVRVARTWGTGDNARAGLQFVGLSREQRTWFERAVRTMRSTTGASEPVAEELGSRIPADDAAAQSLWHLEQALTNRGDRNEHPGWIYGVIADLTPLEKTAILGGEVPSWVHQCIRARLILARYRHDCPVGSPPKQITDACQTVMDLLTNKGDEAYDFDVAEQVSLIKGRIIREFLDLPVSGGAAKGGELPLGELSASSGTEARTPLPPPPRVPSAFQAGADAETSSRRLRLPLPSERTPGSRPFTPAEATPPRAQPRIRRVAKKSGADWVVALCQRTLTPLLCVFIVAVLTAVWVNSATQVASDVDVPVVDVFGPSSKLVSTIEIKEDIASAVVTAAWFGRADDDRIDALEATRAHLGRHGESVRFVFLHSETGTPIALHDFEDRRLLHLEQPLHLKISRRMP